MFIKPRSGALNYDTRAASLSAAVRCEEKTRAQQQFKEESDINTIVRRFGLTGIIPQALRLPSYGDFAEVFDFQTAQNALVAARQSFMQIPADIRMRFGNDPQKFMEFCSDEKNLPELRKLGLAKPEEVPVPEKVVKVEVVTPPAPPVNP